MNTTLSIAFLAGLISFLSPCVLPLIPGYISYISGTSLDKIKEKERNLIIFKTIFFTLGFSFVFIALGATASFIGNFFLTNSNILRIIAGTIIIIPATILKMFELVKKNFPINEAVEPKAMKTKEKPRVKKIVLITTKSLFFSINLSNDVPEI